MHNKTSTSSTGILANTQNVIATVTTSVYLCQFNVNVINDYWPLKFDCTSKLKAIMCCECFFSCLIFGLILCIVVASESTSKYNWQFEILTWITFHDTIRSMHLLVWTSANFSEQLSLQYYWRKYAASHMCILLSMWC